MARRRGRSKTLDEALDQENRIEDYYNRTGRSKTAERIRRKTRDVGGTIDNMTDRVSMRGGDPLTPEGMKMKVSFKDRTTTPTDMEYEAAIARNKRNGNANTSRQGNSSH